MQDGTGSKKYRSVKPAYTDYRLYPCNYEHLEQTEVILIALETNTICSTREDCYIICLAKTYIYGHIMT